MNVNDSYYKELLEQYTDIKLKLSMYEQSMEELDEIDVNDIPSEMTSYADEMYPRIIRLIRQKMIPQYIRDFSKKHLLKVVRVAAVFVLIIYVGLTVAIASSTMVRKYVGNFLIERTERYSRIEFETTDVTVEVPADWMADYYFTYIPDGFSFDSALSDKSTSNVVYTDTKDNSIALTIGNAYSLTHYDTEDFIVDTIDFCHGSAEYAVHENGDKNLTWVLGSNYFILHTTLPYEELIKIAEGIKVIR